MQITRGEAGDTLEMKVQGRLDSYWADQLDSELSAAIREGHHRILLNFSELNFLSSAGIRVLVKSHVQLKGIGGYLAVTEPSEMVREVLELTKLDKVLAPPGEAAVAEEKAAAPSDAVEQVELRTALLEIYKLGAGGMTCRITADKNAWQRHAPLPSDCSKLSFGSDCIALGLGAFGEEYAECRNRFGEFLSAGGAVAYQPTGRTARPDYLISEGDFIPSILVLDTLACQGKFTHQVSFEGKDKHALSLSQLAEQALKVTEAETAVLAIVGEAEGLVGAALKRAPAMVNGFTLRFPQVRDWLTYTAERAHRGSVVLAAGIVTKGRPRLLETAIRRLHSSSETRGHFHAAAFTYRPLRKGKLDLAQTVRGLFEGEHLRGVLHLLSDERPIVGAGTSEFVRGSCWIAPVTKIERQGEAK